MMEILQTVWTALTTENENLIRILFVPLSFVDALVNMLLFSTILNISSSRKRKIIYIISWGIIGQLIRNFIPDPYASFTNLLIGFIFIKFILNATWLKALIAEFIVVAIASIFELFMFRLYLVAFNISYELIMSVPLHRIISIFSIYLCVYLLYKIVRYFKIHIDLNNMTRKNKILFILNTILGITAMGVQFYLICFYSDKMPIAVTALSMLSLLAYFVLSMYSLVGTNKLNTTVQNLEEAQLYNKTLTLLHDSMREFKHDFHNIIQGIGGYIETNNMEGLKKYYSQLLKDCNRVNNLTALNPGIINNPAIYNIMADKYHKADEIDVQINLSVFIDLNEIEKHMKIYEFTRILGILMDNAIEAASDCENKSIHVSFRKEENRSRFVMVIENTYANKDIDINRIFDKDFSTKSKKTNSGLGLWEIRQILKKNNNLDLYTTKNEEYFIQEFSIYY